MHLSISSAFRALSLSFPCLVISSQLLSQVHVRKIPRSKRFIPHKQSSETIPQKSKTRNAPPQSRSPSSATVSPAAAVSAAPAAAVTPSATVTPTAAVAPAGSVAVAVSCSSTRAKSRVSLGALQRQASENDGERTHTRRPCREVPRPSRPSRLARRQQQRWPRCRPPSCRRRRRACSDDRRRNRHRSLLRRSDRTGSASSGDANPSRSSASLPRSEITSTSSQYAYARGREREQSRSERRDDVPGL